MLPLEQGYLSNATEIRANRCLINSQSIFDELTEFSKAPAPSSWIKIKKQFLIIKKFYKIIELSIILIFNIKQPYSCFVYHSSALLRALLRTRILI
jgi:hypothetical protein